MSSDTKSLNRYTETPRDKPMGERTEHANLDRPGAQAHPRARAARDWSSYVDPITAWRVR